MSSLHKDGITLPELEHKIRDLLGTLHRCDIAAIEQATFLGQAAGAHGQSEIAESAFQVANALLHKYASARGCVLPDSSCQDTSFV